VALRNGVAQRRPGTKVELTVSRGGDPRMIALVLGTLPGQDEPAAKRRTPTAKPKAPATPAHGLELADPSDELRARWRLDVRKGAVVTDVAPHSVALRELQPGDVLVEIGDQPVQSAKQARKLLDGANLARGLRLRVERGGFGHYVLLRRDP